MKDVDRRYLYIGKAVNLKNRVRSYFLDSHGNRHQIPYMLKKVAAIEWIATNNETEALILEANLIRNHKPPYNLDLKDDKHYPYLKVTINEAFPRLIVVRRVLNDGAKYFGPYTVAYTMREVMDFAKKIFKIRSCKRKFPLHKPIRPCINYSIDRCSGPCAEKIAEKDYRQNVSMLIQFLKGQRKDVVTILEERMKNASKYLNYEKAASLRDQIKLIRKAPHLQHVDLKTPQTDFDVFGIYVTNHRICLCILSFRQGLLLSRRHFIFKRRLWDTPHADHEAIVLQFYQNAVTDPPDEIIFPPEKGFNKTLLESWFTKQYAQAIRITIPKKGQKTELIHIAEKNARLYVTQKATHDIETILRELMKVLNLPRIPETIEAFDISNLGDKFAVAGMVHFRNGVPDKSRYRRFKIKTVEGQNDFAMLIEAVTRRLTRLKREGKKMPDLLFIDGGLGQLSAAAKPLSEYPNPPMIASLAKREETLFSQYKKGAIKLSQNHPARKFVERIRNEVHRWAISYHRKLRSKQFHRSSLENFTGIGRKKADTLLRRFGSIKKIRETTAGEIATVNGFSISLATKLLKQLKVGTQPSK